MMKRSLFVLLLLCSTSTYSQVQYEAGKKEDFTALIGKPLLVELLQEDPLIIDKLTKKGKKQELLNYQQFIDDYNYALQRAVRKFWKLNAVIGFRTSKQVKQLLEDKNNNYAILSWADGMQSRWDDYAANDLPLPMLVFHSSGTRKAPFIQFTLPRYANHNYKTFPESDIIFAVRFIHYSVKRLLIDGKTKKDITVLLSDNKEQNCAALKSKTLLIDKNLLDKGVTKEDIVQNYPYKILFLPESEISKAAYSADARFAYILTLPYKVLSANLAGAQSGPLSATLSVSRASCLRVVVDAQSGNVLGATGFGFGERNTPMFVPGDFKRYAECKGK
jgi:hypothetical protein